MRKLVFIIVIAAVLVGAASVGARSLWRQHVLAKDVETRIERARGLAQDEQTWSKAAVELREILKLDPDEVEAHRLLGDVCYSLALTEEAIEHYLRLLEIGPVEEKGATQIRLARAYLDRYRGSGKDDDFRASRNSYQDALSDPTSEAEALEGLGALYAAKGRNRDVARALEKFDLLVEKHPDFPDIERVKKLLGELRKPTAAPTAADH